MERLFIGIPILNRLDLLERCVNALDCPAEVLIVNNNSIDDDFKKELTAFAQIKGLVILHQERNLGVSASWNLIIRTGFVRGHKWIFIGSNDTILRPGSLKLAWDCQKDEDVAIWHLCAYNFFLLRKKTIESIGWFDENFYPAYNEDIDYNYRCKLAELRRVHVAGAGGEHFGSATIKSNSSYMASNSETHQKNSNYYRLKWGGRRAYEQFRHPYNDPLHDFKWWPHPGKEIEVRDWDNRYREQQEF